MTEVQLKLRHAHAVREKDTAEAERVRKELEAIGIYGEWLSEDVLVWRDKKPRKKPSKDESVRSDCYPDSACKECGAPIEKTGKPGRPPTKCLKHR